MHHSGTHAAMRRDKQAAKKKAKARDRALEGLPENAEGAFVSLDPIRRALDLNVA